MARKHGSTGRLILGRRLGEKIWIGAVSVEVTKIDGNRVWLGVIASPEVKVIREELLDRPQAGDTMDNAE
jgi:carbon storage regulator CsrA